MLFRSSGGTVRHEPFRDEHLTEQVVVVSATGVGDVDRAVHAAARVRRIPVNVADVPDLCDFILPSILDRSPVIAAFSTGGNAPVLARRLRAQLEALMPEGIGRLAAWLGARRERIRAAVPDATERLRAWERLVDGPVAERVLAGEPVAWALRAQFTLARWLALNNVRKMIGIHRSRYLVTGAEIGRAHV